MKTKLRSHLLTAAFGFAAFSSAGCAEKEPTTAAVPPATPGDTAPTAATAEPAPTKWSDIKDCNFATRAAFFAGLTRLEARVDEQISELTAKRATLEGNASTGDWDFAMKEMVNARTALKSTGEVLAKASPETWDEQKARVGQAWVRTQDAYAKVKASTTR